MYFTRVAVLLSLAASVIAAPTSGAGLKQKRALTEKSYADFQISSGTAGNAEAEAAAVFPIDASEFAGVSSSDLAVIQDSRETAEAAETDGFNPAIEAASGDAATSLQNGKIKNKVLKLTMETLALKIQQAQGADNQDKIDAEQTKLDNNIALDKAAAGQPSQSVDFTG